VHISVNASNLFASKALLERCYDRNIATRAQAMDRNRDGALTVDDVAGRYDTSVHPDVVGGAHNENEVMANFLAMFDGSLGPKSAIVTPEKFLAYYANVSSSIDNDDYFELVLRNVWHLPGGAGSTAQRRLLVTHEDGTQTVETIGSDFDVSKDDLKARAQCVLSVRDCHYLRAPCCARCTRASGDVTHVMSWISCCMHKLHQQRRSYDYAAWRSRPRLVQAIKENLREQGVPVMKVALYGYVDDEGGGGGVLTTASSPKKAPPPPPERESSGRAEDMEPEAAAKGYKQRMAQSNVSFA
jgi:hypothetical protein